MVDSNIRTVIVCGLSVLLFADYQQRLSGESGLLETKPIYFYLYSPQDKVTNRH